MKINKNSLGQFLGTCIHVVEGHTVFTPSTHCAPPPPLHLHNARAKIVGHRDKKGVKSSLLFYKLYYRDADKLQMNPLKLSSATVVLGAVLTGATRQKGALLYQRLWRSLA